MAVDVSTQIVIQHPRQQVTAYAADPDRAPEWCANIKSATWQMPKPLAVSSRVTFIAELMGRRLEYTYEIVDYVPAVYGSAMLS